ncbi:hypothetical protein HPB48_006556 [Haemaphysalis longicornis]|uniref:Uncharacterized protein n=1 Tax=Haemaphysalis longicornis TaxID=44386 RepID=A0A9J6GPE0_HAELO|nr:hypothetical protein HPB48_006556 [Haemaphysalis longicornis]
MRLSGQAACPRLTPTAATMATKKTPLLADSAPHQSSTQAQAAATSQLSRESADQSPRTVRTRPADTMLTPPLPRPPASMAPNASELVGRAPSSPT